jgi:hypothetical protein
VEFRPRNPLPCGGEELVYVADKVKDGPWLFQGFALMIE